MAARRRAQRQLIHNLLRKGQGSSNAYRLGTVTAVAPGAGTDGAAVVSVSIRGSVVAAPWDGYGSTPAVNDVVLVLLVDGKAPFILGKPTGLPSF